MIAFGVFPLFLSLASTAFGGPEASFSLAIIAFGAFEFIQSRFWGRGCDEALFSEKKGFSVERGEPIQ